jgi:hypothetical protein
MRAPSSNSGGVLGGTRGMPMLRDDLVATLSSGINDCGRMVDIEAEDVVMALLDGADDVQSAAGDKTLSFGCWYCLFFDFDPLRILSPRVAINWFKMIPRSW